MVVMLAFAVSSLTTGPAAPVAEATVRNAPVAEASGGEPISAEVDAPPEPDAAVYGLYPIWEETGVVERSRSARIGFGHAEVGLGPVTLGTQPLLDLYGTANAFAKIGLLQRGRLRLALFARVAYVPAAAEQSGVGNVNASTFANPFAPLTLWPAGAALTWIITPRVHAHVTGTLLTVTSPDPDYRSVTGGVSGFVELFATAERSVRVHAGTEGWPAWGQSHVGLSLAWQLPYFALNAGYARRFDPGGLSTGVVMLDGALRFP